MTTVVVPADPMNTACTALRWEWRGDREDLVERYLNQLTAAELAEARMVLRRLALRIDARLVVVPAGGES